MSACCASIHFLFFSPSAGLVPSINVSFHFRISSFRLSFRSCWLILSAWCCFSSSTLSRCSLMGLFGHGGPPSHCYHRPRVLDRGRSHRGAIVAPTLNY